MALNISPIRIVIIQLLVMSLSSAYGQQLTRDYGKQDFDKHCSCCHGQTGIGNDWLSHFLMQEPPNLTLLAKKWRHSAARASL